ncbi:hypothetical protein GNI_054590 [Gregarina niphandrodes]|uniref:Uncharacterized protein n=1 Tax=Gregarina niphandrodes TaxID=110365 RepID=A0A023B923_GRENI|nr:hypothetical protein GNI_054590 [Gregarina niphandrodes]EZG70706.1 hypothetical protein GNI_054590 [Gregarina niphandrodes]|eukprot:XP_011129889.1 hypothetical protein GNI_054590 [Gregarina niphandrodes]
MRSTPSIKNGTFCAEWAIALLGVKVICPFWDDVSDDETLQLVRLSHLYALAGFSRDWKSSRKLATISVTVQSLRKNGIECALSESALSALLARRRNCLTPTPGCKRVLSLIRAGDVPFIDTRQVAPDSLDRMLHYRLYRKLRFTDKVIDYEFTQDAKALAAKTRDAEHDDVFVALKMRAATYSKPERTRIPVATSRPVPVKTSVGAFPPTLDVSLSWEISPVRCPACKHAAEPISDSVAKQAPVKRPFKCDLSPYYLVPFDLHDEEVAVPEPLVFQLLGKDVAEVVVSDVESTSPELTTPAAAECMSPVAMNPRILGALDEAIGRCWGAQLLRGRASEDQKNLIWEWPSDPRWAQAR